jgi:hypothetical protein
MTPTYRPTLTRRKVNTGAWMKPGGNSGLTYRNSTAQERFDLCYMPEPNTGCWLWLGTVNSRGYGRFEHSEHTWTVLAHRIAYAVKHGLFPSAAWVLHKCDQPSCVNPDHLFLGDAKANAQDRKAKGRGAVGSRNGWAVFTEADIRDIRQSHLGPSAIARLYGVNKTTIINIRKRTYWSHVE